MAAFLVERLGVAGAVAILDLQQLAAVVERPAVEGAGEVGLVALFQASQRGTTVRTGVDDRVEFARLVARDHDGLTADVRRQVIVDIGDLAFVGQIDPVALEDVFHLEFKELRISEGGAVELVDLLVVVFDEHVCQAFLDAFKRCGVAHGLSQRVRWTNDRIDQAAARGRSKSVTGASALAGCMSKLNSIS